MAGSSGCCSARAATGWSGTRTGRAPADTAARAPGGGGGRGVRRQQPPQGRPAPRPGGRRRAAPGNVPISTATIRLHDAIALRRTDRRPVAGVPMDETTMLAVANAARPYGAFLRFLSRDRVAALAALVATAERLESASGAWRSEVA